MVIKRRKEASERREVVVTMRLTQEENATLESAAEYSGLSQSDILRSALEGFIRGMKKGFEKFRSEADQGSNSPTRRKGLTRTNGHRNK